MTLTEVKQNEQIVLVQLSNEERLLNEFQKIEDQCENLGKEIKDAQTSFKLSIKCSIQHACEIGRIASEAKRCVKLLPSKADKAKLMHVSPSKLDYKKPTFEDWIESHTGMGRDTVYLMVKLYEKLKEYPDYELPENISWRDALGHFGSKEKLLKDAAVNEVVDEGDGSENDGNEKGESNVDIGYESERKAFNKAYEKIDKVLARFLDTSENLEFKEIISEWKNTMATKISAMNLPQY